MLVLMLMLVFRLTVFLFRLLFSLLFLLSRFLLLFLNRTCLRLFCCRLRLLVLSYRYSLLLSLLDEYMPEGVKWTRPEGGLFLFLTLPEGFDAVAFYDKALSAGVAYVAGEFFHPDRSGKNTMRLNFSFMSPEKITEGVRLLAELLRDEII